MDDESSTTTNGGIGFCGALCVLFIGLKLAGVISWSWLWVLSPLWGPVALVISLIALVFILGIFNA